METITRNITAYLVQKQLLTRDRVVDGGLAIHVSRNRNRIIRVKQNGWPSIFIKQAIESEANAQATIAREASFYEGVATDERLSALRPLLATFRARDDAEHLLVTDLVDDAESVASVLAARDDCPPMLAKKVGAALGTVHAVRFVENAPQSQLFPRKPPWIFEFHGRDNIDWMRRSAVASLVLDIVAADDGARAALEGLRDGWRHTTLIHNDVKLENCLLSPRGAPLHDQALHVVDWELVDIGDPSWDLGSLLHAYLLLWIRSMPDDKEATAAEVAERARLPLHDLHAVFAAVWDGYREAAAGRDLPSGLLERSVAMAGARMLVSAYEIAAFATVLDGRMLLLLQAASNILARPGAAGRDLMGLAA